MTHTEALALIRGGAAQPGGVWADLGAGSGTFTRALAELLGPAGTVHAVDKGTVPRPEESTATSARIIPLRADFSSPLPLSDLDGILMANSLHFVPHQREVLQQLLSSLRPGGAFLLVEYDQARGNPWVPHPLTPARFAELGADIGLSQPREIGRRPSRYGNGEIYAVVAVKR